MSISLPRLDVTQIFCDVDDFCTTFERYNQASKPLPYDGKAKHYRSRLSLSEVMTIVIAFHGSGFRTFKDFYTCQVLPHWRSAFPNLVSYSRFVELVPWSVMLLGCFLQTTLGELTGISFVDAVFNERSPPHLASGRNTASVTPGPTSRSTAESPGPRCSAPAPACARASF